MGKRKSFKNNVVSFHCWSRKKYAAFNSMGKIIKICTLSLAYSLVVIPEKSHAQSGNDSLQLKSYELDDAVVTAERTPVEAQQAARIVTIISRAEIDRAPAQNINDLLRYVAGVDIRQRGPLGTQADLSINGGTFDQTLILLNGVNVTDPQTGHHNLNLPIDLESIERIEILKGPAAKSFGPNAFNGAINIITGNGKKNHVKLSGMYGKYGLYKASGNISNSIGQKFHHFISMNRMASDGYIHNTDFANNNIFYQAKYAAKHGSYYLQAGYNTKSFGANSFYSLAFPNQFESTQTKFASVKYETNTRIKFASTLYWRQHRDRFERNRNVDTLYKFNHHLTDVCGINLNTWTTHQLGKTSIGIDFRNEHIFSTVLGTGLNIPIAIPDYNNKFYTKDYNRFNTSIYAQHSVYIGSLSVSAGLMALYNTNLNGFKIYPGLDISYKIIESLKIFTSINKTLRMPTFTDMFYKSPIQQGNSSVKPEEAVTFEGGLKYENSLIQASISGFYRWGYNMIDWVKSPSADSIIWRTKNLTNVNFTGGTASLRCTPSQINYLKWINFVSVSYTNLIADSSRNNLLSKYVLDYLKDQVVFSFDHLIFYKLNASWRVAYQNRMGKYSDASKTLVSYKPFWLADAKVYWKEKHYTVFAEASNLFNVKYFDFGGIVQPGIWVRGGVIIDLDY